MNDVVTVNHENIFAMNVIKRSVAGYRWTAIGLMEDTDAVVLLSPIVTSVAADTAAPDVHAIA